MPLEESVRIVNEGTEELNLPYDGRLYTLAPGQSRFFPADVMYAWMGNPTVRNTEYDRWRDEAYRNLIIFYGGAAAHMNDENPRDYLPALVAYDSNDNQILTILDDPEGNHLTVDAPVGSDEQILARRVAQLEAKLAEKSGDKPVRKPRKPRPDSSNATDAPPEPVGDQLPPADTPDIIKVD